MIDHYNAFISYRHAPADIRVAETVQRSLEHFHIPKKIRKQTGKKRIQRIFRDKDELPITSNLTDTISHALEVSDYLIVICSTSTKESIWVQREIEFFLRNHTKNQILTVLVDGEDPYEVIPEILQYDERYITDETGRMTPVRYDIEPLSCDFRMPFSKAKKVELPRLASAIIGCSYDELMNRRRQYAMRRMGIISAAVTLCAAGFSAYMFYSRRQIKMNYLNSLKNQSKYLANESMNMLDNEQRITALQLAIEALPKDEKDDRPETPEAVRAVTDATLAYVPDINDNIFAAWNYAMPAEIKSFEIAPDGRTLAAFDSAGSVTMWSTSSHEKIIDMEPGAYGISGIKYLSNGYLLVWGDEKMTAYSARDGSVAWSAKGDGLRFSGEEAVLTTSDSFILETRENGEDFFSEYSEVNGTLIKKHPFTIGDTWGTGVVYKFALSPDNTRIAIIAGMNYMDYAVGILDLKTDKLKLTEATSNYIKDIYWVDDTRLMYSDSDVRTNSNMSFGDISLLSTDYYNINCINPADMSVHWTSEFSSNDVMINSEFFYLPKTNSVAYYSGNIASMYDIETGECLFTHNANDSIVHISDNDGNGYPLYISEEGGYFYPNPNQGKDALIGRHYFTDEIKKVAIDKGVYILKSQGNEIIFYGLLEYDHNWTEFKHGLEFNGTIDWYKDENVLVIESDKDEEEYINIFSLGDFETVSQYKPDSNYSLGRFILGSDKDYVYMVESHDDGNYLISIKIKNGQAESMKLTDDNFNMKTASCFRDGKIFYMHSGESWDTVMSVYDTNMKDTADFSVSDKGLYGTVAPMFYPGCKRVYIPNDYGDIMLDTETGDIIDVKLPEFWDKTLYFSKEEDTGRFLITDTKLILLVNSNGTVSFPIRCPGVIPLGMTFVKNPISGETEIVVVYSDGSLYRYSDADGSFISKSEFTDNNLGDSYQCEFEVDYEKNLLYVSAEQTVNIFDIENWYEIACIDFCLGHDKATDRFISLSSPKTGVKQIGYFEHYSTEELIEKAKDILQGQELTEAQKSLYGIEDN